MVRRLLDVYEDQNVREIDKARKRKNRGCKGLAFGGEAHVLDAAEILNQIWSIYDKYAKTTSVRNCWKNLIS